jgi:hypothetical protein
MFHAGQATPTRSSGTVLCSRSQDLAFRTVVLNSDALSAHVLLELIPRVETVG